MNDEEKSFALKQMHDTNLYLNNQLRQKDKELEFYKDILNQLREILNSDYFVIKRVSTINNLREIIERVKYE